MPDMISSFRKFLLLLIVRNPNIVYSKYNNISYLLLSPSLLLILSIFDIKNKMDISSTFYMDKKLLLSYLKEMNFF